MLIHIDTKGYTEKPKEHISIIKPRLQGANTIKDIDLETLIKYIQRGYSISPAVMNGKGCKAENWKEQRLFMVDIDNDKSDKPVLSVSNALEICNRYNLPPAFYYYSFSHSEQKEKYRLCFVMNETVTNQALRAVIAQTLVKLFPQSDTSCTNADRIFYGTNKDVVICDLSATIDIENVLKLQEPQQQKQVKTGNEELDRLKEDFDFFRYLQERNGKMVFNNSKCAMFERCEICGHKKDLVYYHETKTFNCFGASGNVGGSVIDYIIAVEKTDLKGAIDRLYELSGITRPSKREYAIKAKIKANEGIVSKLIELDAYRKYSLDDIYEAVVNTEGQGNPEEVKPFLITVDKKVDGVKVPTIANVASNYLDIMRYDRYFSIVKYNTLSGLPEKHKVKGKSQWTDADDASARTYIEANYSIFNRQKYEDAFAEFQHEREYCPIKDKINSLVWDGQKRVENFLCKWLGADDTPYNRECSRLLFAGGINRAYRAGCKFDDVIVLIGKQGGGKSTICQWLALDMELYSSIKTINGQKGLEGISGKWIVEIEELLATLANDYSGTKSEENCKAFLSTASDFYRKPYDRRPTDSPRRCIFIGTTNRTEFLTDKTGNRRWYPVTVKSDARFLYDNEKECKEYISQCWAEMKSAFDRGDDFAKPVENVSLLSAIKSKQSEAEQDDWREGVIEEYLDGKIRTCLIEIWQRALYKDRSPHFPEMKRKDSNELIGIVVNKLGWTRGNAENFNGFGKQKSFYNPKADEEIKKLDAELPK